MPGHLPLDRPPSRYHRVFHPSVGLLTLQSNCDYLGICVNIFCASILTDPIPYVITTFRLLPNHAFHARPWGNSDDENAIHGSLGWPSLRARQSNYGDRCHESTRWSWQRYSTSTTLQSEFFAWSNRLLLLVGSSPTAGCKTAAENYGGAFAWWATGCLGYFHLHEGLCSSNWGTIGQWSVWNLSWGRATEPPRVVEISSVRRCQLWWWQQERGKKVGLT